MPDSEGMFDMDAIRTFAVSSAANPSGSDVARMLRVAADHMATEVGPIESIMADTAMSPSGPVLHLRFWWTMPTSDPPG